MISFPNAKINIGLNITERRPDGYHNLETVFYPIPLTDVLEFVPSKNGKTTLEQLGVDFQCHAEDNLVMKAYRMYEKEYKLPPIEIILEKHIPSGAGLGGGSSDAAFMLKMLNEFFSLNISEDKMIVDAAKLGADCAFFVKNKPVYATGIGDVMTEIDLSLKDYYLFLVKPDFSIPTKEAYSIITPQKPAFCVKDAITENPSEWKGKVINDFEEPAARKYNIINEIVSDFYSNGATYAAMSGSGSSIYGIFKDECNLSEKYKDIFNFQKKLDI